MGQTFEYLKMALQNIRANKGRSLLTMLGIIIGISSVITIMSVGAGFKNEMNKQLDSIAGGQIYLYLSDEGQKREEYMTEDDFAQIESKIDGVTGTSPVFGAAGSTKTLKGEFTVNLTGGGTAQQEISKWKVVRGRYFNQSDIDTANRVCVVSKKDAISMFGTDDVVGMNIEIASDNSTGDFQIIGIVEQENLGNMVTMEYGDEQSVSMDIPYTAMDVFGYDTSSFAYLYITTDKSADTGKVANAAIALLNQLHYSSGESYYDMENFTDQMSSINDYRIYFAGCRNFSFGWWNWCHEYYVSICDRTYEGDWYPKIIRSKNFFDYDAVFGRVGNHCLHWGLNWNYNWCGTCLCGVFDSNTWFYAGN